MTFSSTPCHVIYQFLGKTNRFVNWNLYVFQCEYFVILGGVCTYLWIDYECLLHITVKDLVVFPAEGGEIYGECQALSRIQYFPI